MRFFLPRENPREAFAQLEAGLTNLSLGDNFPGFSWEGIIESASEVSIPNKSPQRRIPRGYFVTYAKGTNAIIAGDTEWTERYLSLKNIDGSNDATLKVFFFL